MLMGGSRMARNRQTDQVRPQARSATTSFAPDPSGLQALQRTAGNAAVTVTPVVYDLATKRTNGNDYAWGYGGGKNAGTSSASAGKAMALG